MMNRSNSSRYKKFFFRTLIFSGIGWLCLQLVVYFYCRPNEWYWIYETIKIKENVAHNIPGPKIVLVGGSATLFGVRTADLEKALNIPTVNYGVHAALEIDYILERAKKILKPGDTVILPLEYNHLLYDGSINEVRARFILLFDENYYNSLPFFEKINYFFKFSPITIELTLWNTFWNLLGSKNQLRSYDTKTMNQNGDETNNQGNAIVKSKYPDMQPFAIGKGGLKETAGLKILNNFNKWAQEHNIRFYVTYAPTIAFDVYHSPEYQDFFNKIQAYFKERQINTIGSPNDFFYPPELFYDTQYHLNAQGMTLHTEKLLEKLTKSLSAN